MYREVVTGPFYRDTVSWNLPVTIGGNGYGENLFSPYVDAFNQVNEMAEGNNGLTSPIQINIQSDDIIPIYPYEFAIVPQQGVTPAPLPLIHVRKATHLLYLKLIPRSYTTAP